MPCPNVRMQIRAFACPARSCLEASHVLLRGASRIRRARVCSRRSSQPMTHCLAMIRRGPVLFDFSRFIVAHDDISIDEWATISIERFGRPSDGRRRLALDPVPH